jgi:hypothetical protein
MTRPLMTERLGRTISEFVDEYGLGILGGTYTVIGITTLFLSYYSIAWVFVGFIASLVIGCIATFIFWLIYGQ